jgi:hypothetical protein
LPVDEGDYLENYTAESKDEP